MSRLDRKYTVASRQRTPNQTFHDYIRLRGLQLHHRPLWLCLPFRCPPNGVRYPIPRHSSPALGFEGNLAHNDDFSPQWIMLIEG